MTDWTEKYRPSTLSEVRGNDKARDALKQWAASWDEHRDAVIVHGRPGVGKTSAAHALANDMGWDVIELNASDSRTKDVIERVAGEAAKSGTLTGGSGGRKLLILDEADNLHGNADRGGAAAITRVVKDASQPIVLIANEFYEMSNALRRACEDIEFRDVSKRSIVPVLRDICRREGVEYEDAALDAIASKNSGDLRSAVNDLQALAETNEVLTADDVVTGERDTTEGIFDFLDDVIKNLDAESALKASYDVDENPNDLINWIEDNMPKDFEGSELADAYGFIAKGDQWLGRVRATQNYSYWRYVSDNVVAGTAASRQGSKGGWTRYGPPSYWSKLGRTKGTRNTRDHVASQIADRSGVSMATARREIMPVLAAMTHHCKPRELTVAMAAAYDLDAAHVSFITGSGEDTNKVQQIVEDAEEQREEAAVEHSGGAFEGATRDERGTEGEVGERGDGDGSSDDFDALVEDDENESAADPEEADEDDSQAGLDEFF
ncbi:replication factor C large subunit [Halocalculus aciditolerans]|uniref:Replication factor C large subunit n=1 Tax=Halocalculus aciditolerans TaxID=1383812 RepID=A0A830FH61_9EURY|nr:replication factor C large subunit [Halocalculus aciditolerans]GGL52228.1 ATPase AAA [Halocalculus aciditolerans]